jgi:Tfp pilus assembly protein PilV
MKGREGLSLVEVIVAMVVLTAGLLGMAAGTGWMIRAVDLAQLETARGAALQAAVEELRATPWADLDDGQGTFGGYAVSWTGAPGGTANSRVFNVEIVGPGRDPASTGVRPAIATDAATTLTYRINRR